MLLLYSIAVKTTYKQSLKSESLAIVVREASGYG